MRRDLLIAAGPGEWRAAWLEDKAAVELYVERGDTAPPGSIILGRVVRRVAGLDANLVDIGEARLGFLRERVPLNEGASVTVRVRREAQRGKGALLSACSEAGAAAPTGGRPPFRIAPAADFAAALAMRLPGPPERVLSDDVALLPALRAAFPQADVIRIDPQDSPVDLDAAFEAALAPTASLAGGGSIHIIEAEAATLIDVDTGSPEAGTAERAIAAINMEAARAIAHHMRLRQLGGGILVDFASLDARGPRERIRRELEKAIASDPAQPRLLGWSRLGHLEIVRPRRLRPLSDVLLSPPLRDKTPLAVAFEALRAVYRESRARPSAAWSLVVDADVEAALRGPAAAALRSLEERLGRKLEIARAAVGGSRVDIVET